MEQTNLTSTLQVQATVFNVRGFSSIEELLVKYPLKINLFSSKTLKLLKLRFEEGEEIHKHWK